MPAKRARIDRRLPTPTPASNVVAFADDFGERGKVRDFSALGLPDDVATLLAEAFRSHYAASREAARRTSWTGIKVFARFVREEGGLGAVADLTTAMVWRYIAWLDRQSAARTGAPWTKSVRANCLTNLKQLIHWTKRRRPEALTARIDFPYNVYSNRCPETRPRVSEAQLKAILAACYEEIDEAWEKFALGQLMLGAKDTIDGIDAELCWIVRTIAAIEGGALPTQSAVRKAGVGFVAIARHGGLRDVAQYLHLTTETFVPFYVAIAIQLAANPEALRHMARDCQIAHPLDDTRTIVEWAKPRAGRRAQRRSFDRRRTYAAPNLIDKVKAMTAPLAANAAPGHRHLLFLLISEKTRAIAPVSGATASQNVKRFIARANVRIKIWNRAAPERKRETIEDFAPAFLRGSVATEHYKATGGDILAVQTLLNHASVDTTERYIKGPEAARIECETIARLQRLMLSWIANGAAPPTPPPIDTAIAANAETLAGHRCLNPVVGRQSRICPHFGGCLRCPGLVIPIDATHLARLLQARRSLIAARERLDPRRFALLYAPSLAIVESDILPDFPMSCFPEAEALLADLPPLPELE